jgi:hypothetical protein
MQLHWTFLSHCSRKWAVWMLIAVLVLHAISFVVSTMFRLKERNLPALASRVISNLERGAVRTVAMLGWFAMIQYPDTIRMTILPNIPLVLNLEQLIVWAVAGVTILATTYTAGMWASRLQQKWLWAEFEACAPAHYHAMVMKDEINSNSLALTKRSALITEFLVKMGLGHWEDARKSLKLFQRSELDLAYSVEQRNKRHQGTLELRGSRAASFTERTKCDRVARICHSRYAMLKIPTRRSFQQVNRSGREIMLQNHIRIFYGPELHLARSAQREANHEPVAVVVGVPSDSSPGRINIGSSSPAATRG